MAMISSFDQVRAIGTDFQADFVSPSLNSPFEVHHLCSSIQVSYESRIKKQSMKQKQPEAPPAPGFERGFSRLPGLVPSSQSNSRTNILDEDEGEPDDEKELFAHQFTFDGLKFNWNATTRDAILRVIKTFREARLLGFYLTLGALHPVGAGPMSLAGLVSSCGRPFFIHFR
jgi:hypothetical protein